MKQYLVILCILAALSFFFGSLLGTILDPTSAHLVPKHSEVMVPR